MGLIPPTLHCVLWDNLILRGNRSEWRLRRPSIKVDLITVIFLFFFFNAEKVREKLKVYCQTLMGGFQDDTKSPRNLSKVTQVRRGLKEH